VRFSREIFVSKRPVFSSACVVSMLLKFIIALISLTFEVKLIIPNGLGL
jgi:hypothetical protein